MSAYKVSVDKKHLVAVLPTGDWSEIRDGDPLYVYEMNDDEYAEFVETGGEDVTLGECVHTYNGREVS